jgi:multimeric flavodoxin WrbA
MKISILNGSPKGDQSVTMQYILYVKKKIPQHEYEILNVAQQIKRLEKDDQAFQDVLEKIKTSDGIIWGFPLYSMLVSSQYKRFIELIFEKNAQQVFENKYTMSLLTSIHFFDHTAENYIHGICDDLNMNYIGFFSADSWDLLYPQRRANWIKYAEHFFDAIENKMPTVKQFLPITHREFNYTPQESLENDKKVSTQGKNVLIITDSLNMETNLGKMVNYFKNCFLDDVNLINIHDLDIKGGCLGCAKCGYDHQCVYFGKDGFREFWENKVMKADVIVFAGAIKDRFLSSSWKMIYDRAFYNNHTPTIIGKQVGYIFSGPLGQIPNLREIYQSHIEIHGSNLVDFVTDEYGDSQNIDSRLYNLAKLLIKFSISNLIKPQTFLAVGGTKLFRDDVYGRNRFIFLADHKYYEEHGIYDTFPQNDKRAIELNNKLIPLMKIDKIRNKMDFKEEFLKPFKKIISDPNK